MVDIHIQRAAATPSMSGPSIADFVGGTASHAQALDLIRRRLRLDEVQSQALDALMRELGLVSDLIEVSVDDLAARFRDIAEIARQKT